MACGPPSEIKSTTSMCSLKDRNTLSEPWCTKPAPTDRGVARIGLQAGQHGGSDGMVSNNMIWYENFAVALSPRA